MICDLPLSTSFVALFTPNGSQMKVIFRMGSFCVIQHQKLTQGAGRLRGMPHEWPNPSMTPDWFLEERGSKPSRAPRVPSGAASNIACEQWFWISQTSNRDMSYIETYPTQKRKKNDQTLNIIRKKIVFSIWKTKESKLFTQISPSIFPSKNGAWRMRQWGHCLRSPRLVLSDRWQFERSDNHPPWVGQNTSWV